MHCHFEEQSDEKSFLCFMPESRFLPSVEMTVGRSGIQITNFGLKHKKTIDYNKPESMLNSYKQKLNVDPHETLMVEFIPASELKKEFDVFGHFYSIKVNSEYAIDCRSVLEIINKDNNIKNFKSLSSMLPDAIFIMMNPGSSKPLNENNKIISYKNTAHLEVSLIPTKPDTTQYQLMRVMHFFKINHVRVLNLSDMRDPKSGRFVERYRQIENKTGFIEHSIFSDIRGNELQNKLQRKKAASVICAWGVSPDLDPLIERCINKISNTTEITGLLKKGTKNKYFHPLPTLQKDKEKWVNNMIEQIKSLRMENWVEK